MSTLKFKHENSSHSYVGSTFVDQMQLINRNRYSELGLQFSVGGKNDSKSILLKRSDKLNT